MDKLAYAANNFQLRLAGILMDMWIFFLFVAIADIYCAEQIKIPPTYPYIIKQYAKAAIRTQPYDLLQWTCAYFRALANCDIPPVKERLEYPPFSHPSGITPGYLKTLVNVFGHVENVCLRRILSSWQGIALPETTLFRMLLVGKFLSEKECDFYKFLAIACGFLGKNLFETMIYVCELLTEEPEGGSAMIPVRTFVRLYEYLAMLDCSGECPYAIMEDDTKEISPPSESSTLTSTFDSRLYLVPSAVEEEEESGKLDVCPLTPSESRSSGILQVLKDYSDDARPSGVDEAQQEVVVVAALNDQIDVGSMVSEKISEREVLGLSCVFALWLSSHVSVHAHQPIMLRNTDPFSDTNIEDGLSERWFSSYNHSGIVLGTLWCGRGNISSGPNVLGTLKSTDACCRTHDMCPDIIEARGTKHGLTNTADYTRLSCDCDEKFRQCLKKSKDEISGQLVGMGYFTVLGTKCFRVDYPIVRCIERSWFFSHCEKYELDTKGQKKYQWFDVHTF